MLRMTHQNLCHPVRHQTPTLTLTLKYPSHHYHLPMNSQNLPECKKFEIHSNAPIIPTTLPNQQTHRRISSISNFLSKFGKPKVMVPSPPSLPITGGYYSGGGGGTTQTF